MREEELARFLNKRVKLYFDIGQNNNFTYCGTIIEVNSDNVTLLDRKIGQTILANDRIIQIAEWNGGNKR